MTTSARLMLTILALLVLTSTASAAGAGKGSGGATAPVAAELPYELRPIPRGVVSLTPSGAQVPDEILANSHVTAVTIRTRWPKVEPFEGRYAWSYLDTQIARVAAAGKRVILRVVSGGITTPAWVYAAGAQSFEFVDQNRHSPTYGTTLRIPVFWDRVFLAKKQQFIGALGRRYAENPAVAVVSTSCANARTDDWNVPDTDDDIASWLALDYTSEKLVQACREILDAAAAAFPATPALIAVGNSGGTLDADPDAVPATVVAYARARYPGRLVVQKNSLSAKVPDPITAAALGPWRIVYDSAPDVAAQMLWSVTGDDTCRMNGGRTPCDPATTLRKAITRGARYGTLYQEIYQHDILNPDLEDVIREAADLLGSPAR